MEGGELGANAHRKGRLLHQDHGLRRRIRTRCSSRTAPSSTRSTAARLRDVPWGGDNHDIWIDPMNADHFGLTDDAGARDHDASRQGDHRRAADRPDVPRRRRPRRCPIRFYTNRQDNSTMRGPSIAPEASADDRRRRRLFATRRSRRRRGGGAGSCGAAPKAVGVGGGGRGAPAQRGC